ncbi:MAG: M15 family metallopeptidase [Clostridiaceae bacterium]
MKFSAIRPIAIACLAAILCTGCTANAPSTSTPEPTAALVASAEVITFAETSAPSVTPQLTPTPNAAKSASTAIIAGTGDKATASAAAAAQMLRMEETSELINYWATVQPDASNYFRQRKAVRAMLACTVGNGVLPVGREGIQFQPDPEVPLMEDGAELFKGVDYNTRGSIYTDSPLTSVTAAMISRGDGKSEEQTVTFDPTENIYDYSLDTKSDHSERKGLGDLFDTSSLSAGRYTFTLTATTVAKPTPVTLYSAECSISDTKDMFLTQNKFDDNYAEVYAFFKGDTSKFLFQYWIRDGRSISTDTEWRENTLVESSLGRVNSAAVAYFELANYYIDHTYVSVTIVNRKNNKQTDGRVTPLRKLISKETTYVPRFQSNLQYVSHHTLGLAIDVNDDMYPNKNIETNHELIGTDVRDHLVYNGIKTDEKGQQYYDFTYDGAYSARFERVPKTIINYLLYELAFFRAGFQWGYYYESACDGMHFTLAEFDINRHMYSDVGLRKIYEYIEDDNIPTLESLKNGLPSPTPEGVAPTPEAATPTPEG